MRTRLRRFASLAVLLVATAVTSGCFNPFAPRVATNRGNSEQVPVPSSPRSLMELFKWCWENRAYDEYRQVFTDDFRFFAAYVDPDSASYNRVENREDELAAAKHLFQGGKADEPPANRITLDFSSDLVALPDPRPGKTYPVHQVIQTSVTLSVDTDIESFRVTGDTRFFMVRGDSAVIPSELGVGPNDQRWYIERWEDLTGAQGMVAAALEHQARSGLPGAPRSMVATLERPTAGRPGASRVVPSPDAAVPRPGTRQFELSWALLKRIYR